jgi:integrase
LGGHRISANHTLERLKKVLLRLGIKGHLHTFRHFFISYCADRGVPLFQLMKWVGHADVSTVMHYYALHDAESMNTMRRLSAGERQGAHFEASGATG